METFADYILGETDYIKKLEIAYYLQKRTGIFPMRFPVEMRCAFKEQNNGAYGISCKRTAR